MAQGGKSTPIDAGLIARVVAGVKYIVGGADGAWMGPLQPIAPMADAPAQETAGRQFDYPVGYNMQIKPRTGETVSFADMRALADGYDLLRLVIETRKDQLAKMKWAVKPKDEASQPDSRCDEITAFLAMPDKEHVWDEWLRMLVEDMLVIDAATLYPRMTKGGKLYSLEPVDGATIKRVIDGYGRTPAAPDPAYQQVLKGLPAVDYTADQLIYRPRNPRTSRIYGYSPVEQIIMTVNIALRRQLNQLSYYTEGNIPDMIFGVPAEWNPDQIAQFQTWWDSVNQGQTKHKGLFIPDGVNPINTRETHLKDEMDDWLARIVCFAFSIAPTPFIKANNRATAGTAQEQSITEGLAPIQQWIKGLIDGVIVKYFGYTDIEFDWNEETAIDPLAAAQIAQIYVASKIITPNEARADLGREAMTAAQLEELKALAPPPPPMTPNPDEPGQSKEEPPKPSAAKSALVKKKSIRRIDRNRPSIIKARAKLEKKLTKFLADQAPGIAAQITKALNKVAKAPRLDNPKKAAEIAAAIDFTAWVDDMPGFMSQGLAGIAVDGGGEGLDQLDIFSEDVLDLMRLDAKAWAADRSAEMVGMKLVDGELVANPDARWVITDATRDGIQSFVGQALDEGWSMDELAANLADTYSFSADRAETIARTETAMADVNGSMIGWRASGQVGGKEWLTADDDLVSEDCAANGEQGEIPLNAVFQSGADAPPEHPNCRCDVAPVLTEDNTND